MIHLVRLSEGKELPWFQHFRSTKTSNKHFIALPAVIHLVRLSEGKELHRFQHFRSTKTSNKFLNAWGKIIRAETLLDENMFVACKERLHL